VHKIFVASVDRPHAGRNVTGQIVIGKAMGTRRPGAILRANPAPALTMIS
jgi:hypothetical protein